MKIQQEVMFTDGKLHIIMQDSIIGHKLQHNITMKLWEKTLMHLKQDGYLEDMITGVKKYGIHILNVQQQNI